VVRLPLKKARKARQKSVIAGSPARLPIEQVRDAEIFLPISRPGARKQIFELPLDAGIGPLSKCSEIVVDDAAQPIRVDAECRKFASELACSGFDCGHSLAEGYVIRGRRGIRGLTNEEVERLGDEGARKLYPR
jgi:hypothetical protein